MSLLQLLHSPIPGTPPATSKTTYEALAPADGVSILETVQSASESPSVDRIRERTTTPLLKRIRDYKKYVSEEPEEKVSPVKLESTDDDSMMPLVETKDAESPARRSHTPSRMTTPVTSHALNSRRSTVSFCVIVSHACTYNFSRGHRHHHSQITRLPSLRYLLQEEQV